MSASQISSCNSLNPPLSGSRSDTDRASSTRQVQHALRASVADALGLEGSGHGVRGIASALRDLLAKADPSSPDPVPSLLQTINTALDSAGKKLADQGVDQATIDASIKRFRSELSREIDALTPASGADSPADSPAPATSTAQSAAAIHAVTKEKFTLNIRTNEGDAVSIKFRSTNVTDVAAVQTTDDAGTTTATDAHVLTRGRLKIEVKGDLNADELKAIGDLLDKVDDIAQSFFGGDIQAAFGAAARVGFDTQELSGFNLKLSYSQRIGFASTYAAAASAAAAPVAGTPTVPAPASKTATSSGAVTPTTLPAAAQTPASDAPSEATGVATQDSSAAPADPSLATPAPAASAQQTIASFTKDVLAKLAQVSDGGGSVRFSLRWKVDFLLTALSAVAPVKDPAVADATKALGDSLNGSAAAAS